MQIVSEGIVSWFLFQLRRDFQRRDVVLTSSVSWSKGISTEYSETERQGCRPSGPIWLSCQTHKIPFCLEVASYAPEELLADRCPVISSVRVLLRLETIKVSPMNADASSIKINTVICPLKIARLTFQSKGKVSRFYTCSNEMNINHPPWTKIFVFFPLYFANFHHIAPPPPPSILLD